MEGLLDAVLRDVLTRAGDYDWAVCEFARVSDTVLPHRYFRRVCPELLNGGRTAAGTAVRVQLLGSDPACLADNAAHLVELQPAGIDLNFGCPAPTVNRHRGGAVLLDEPELLFAIASAVRSVVPPGVPFTAKMRLGVSDAAKALDCARALADGGVEEIVVHARTKLQGYRPPAHWPWIARIAEAVPIPVIANGEVWSETDWLRCRAESGVADVMLGRGAVADPFMVRRIRMHRAASPALFPAADRTAEWRELCPLLASFWRQVQDKVLPAHAPGRFKQWLNLLQRNFPHAETLFQEIRPMRRPPEINAVLMRHGIVAEPTALAA
ncbi:dihydrouridine synthase [Aromatoleum diolicum]|uniref:tRNA-dihydrouridine(16) synthase n=2 Tax=Aromatoleum diolicum TaxID=75796 RepID=A0ABX1QD08_9RHOO|nr:tRNA-dihydrouridine synthase family protein [Aromatoleum diolicum]NMG74921.1 dihydrouridine synthase [Aromatoleum diolicum]